MPMLDARLAEIIDLIESELRPDSMRAGAPSVDALPDVLRRTLAAEGLLAGVVWLTDGQNRMRVHCETGMRTLVPHGKFAINAEHQGHLNNALRQGQIVCQRLKTGDGQDAPECTVAIGPLFRQSETIGVLELFAAPGLPEAETHRLINGLDRLCDLCGTLLNQEPEEEQEDREFWERFDRFTLNLSRSLDVAEVAAAAVNDARTLLGCDRVSLALLQGNHAAIRAVSGQERVQSRSNLIREMARLSEAAMAAGETVTYRGTMEGFPPQIEHPLAQFVLESRSRMVMLAPLRRHRSPDPGRKPSASTTPEPVIGCLVIEQSTEPQPRAALVRRLDLVSDHVAAALANARQHSELFLLPVWRSLGRGLAWFQGRRRWAAAAILAGLFLVGSLLAIVPWRYTVEADGRAMPVIRREVFAPWDGEVIEVFVESGRPVTAGDPLLRIDSDDLNERYIVARSEVDELAKLRDSLRIQLQGALEEADRQEQRRLGAELMAAGIRLTAAERQADQLAGRIAALTVRAPIDGVVVTYQLSQNLEGRPVNRGELMLQVMNDHGPWRLELEVPDHRMGHVLRAIEQSESGQLNASYVPATAVEMTLQGIVHRDLIATRSNRSAQAETVVEVFASIDPVDLPQRHIGADVTARIDCGQQSLGYVLFGDVIEFVQRKVWW